MRLLLSFFSRILAFVCHFVADVRMHQRKEDTNTVQVQQWSLHELITFTVRYNDQKEPGCVVYVGQPFVLLSRDQVRRLYRILLDAGASLSHLKSCSQEELDSYDAAEETLHEKIRYVTRSAQQQYPAIIGVSASSPLELTRDELTVLEIQVMFLAQDLDIQDAHWFYAEPAMLVGVALPQYAANRYQRVRQSIG